MTYKSIHDTDNLVQKTFKFLDMFMLVSCDLQNFNTTFKKIK